MTRPWKNTAFLTRRRVLLLTAGIASAAFAYVFLPPLFRSPAPVDVPVYTGSSTRDIAHRLKERGILTAETPFKALCILTRADRRLKAGLYRMTPRMSLWSVWGTLVSGKADLLTLKVPEGFTAAQIAAELERLGVMDATAFLAAVRDPSLAKALGLPARQLEGFLYPETYRVPLGAGAEDLLRLMVTQFQQSSGDGFEALARKQGLTGYQAVILASIVEKETRVDAERSRVAGVLYNRLRKKMRLEVNATLNYVLPDRRSWLTFKQIAVESPYNTYQHRGLPPTPICNPGRAALKAVLSPEANGFLYYVAQTDGTHLFASTFEGHQANVKTAKAERRRQKLSGVKAPATQTAGQGGGWVGLDGRPSGEP